MSGTKAPSQAQMARRVSRRFPLQLQRMQHRHYAKWKILLDPLYGAVRDELSASDLPVLDIGCGVGLLAFYLRESGLQMPIYGVDFDAAKIATAQKVASAYPSAPQFETGDMRRPWPEVYGNVCLLDILQYLTPESREELLTKAAAHVKPGGLLIIRGSLEEPTWRWKVNVFMDHVAKRLTWMKADPVSYPTREELQTSLGNHGLKLHSSRPLWGKTPFNTHFLAFKRPETTP